MEPMTAPAAESPANLKRQTAGPVGGVGINALEELGLVSVLGLGFVLVSESVSGESDVVAMAVSLFLSP